jgi:GAF domain-containing protein
MSEPAGGQADLASGLTQLATLLLSVEDVEDALRHLARMAVVVVPDGPTCGITVRRRGRYTTIVHAGSIPASVHELQYTVGQGPCLEALSSGTPVVAQDLAAEHRWGDFPRQALATGAHGACAFPLEADGQVVGALNLYTHQPGLFPEPVQQIAAQFVEPASILLAGVLRRLSQAETILQLRVALATRGVIDQAIGIIIARRHCSPERAFQILRKVSNDRNIKLRAVAADVVRTASAGDQVRRRARPADGT